MQSKNEEKNIQELKQKIETMRDKLNKIANEKEKFTQKEVIKVSQELDELLNQLYNKLY